MRVKRCARCPYTPRDLADHYDPKGGLHACARCDGYQAASTNQYPRKTHRRQKCATVLNISGAAQPSVVRSATENLASFDTTPGEPPSVQKNARTASRNARRVTAVGYVDFKLPDNVSGETTGVFFEVQDSGAGSLPSEPLMQTPPDQLSLLRVGAGSSGARWTKPGRASPPSAAGSTSAREILFNMAYARSSDSQLLQ